MRDDPTVVALVVRARAGDKFAWDEIVDRYQGMIWRICLGHRLNSADAHDVGQTVWMLLFEQLDSIREPAALPGWLATTARRECSRLLRKQNRELVESPVVEKRIAPDRTPVDEEMLLEEQRIALRAAFAQLPAGCQELLRLLMQVPPLSYADISERLGEKIGSLGPRRGRCLEKLRQYPPLAALIEDAQIEDTQNAERGESRDRPMVGK